MASLEEAAAFVDHAGIAVVYPQADLVLPRLWDAIAGGQELEWAIRDAKGRFVDFTPEFGQVWRWKDELPERRLACVGRHLGRFVAVIAPRLVGAVCALRAAEPADGLERELADAVREHGPLSGPELRALLGVDAKPANRAVDALQRKCVLTSAGQVRQAHGWPAIRLELLERRWRPEPPEEDEARALLAETVLRAAGEVSAADLAAALGLRLRDAAATLESHGARLRDENGIAIYGPRDADRPHRQYSQRTRGLEPHETTS